MKLIFSRKGSDSGSGGGPSPILPDGRLFSLPIPDPTSHITYGQVCDGAGLPPDLIAQLTRERIPADSGCHLDPDLRRDSLPRDKAWRPLFGQTRAAQKHLENQEVGAGDLFLFYGWFRQTELAGGSLRFAKEAPELHVLFGWLQVDRAVRIPGDCPPEISWAGYHPHFHFTREGRDRNNTLYVARQWLDLPGIFPRSVPGGGVFDRFRPELQLTADGEPRSTWRLPWFFASEEDVPGLSYHKDPDRWLQEGGGTVLLKTVARGQEFALKCDCHDGAREWAAGILYEESDVAMSAEPKAVASKHFSARELAAIRKRIGDRMGLSEKLMANLPDGWSIYPLDPLPVREAVVQLELKSGLELRAYQYSASGNGNALAFALPADSALPEPHEILGSSHEHNAMHFDVPRPPDALEDRMEAFTGSPSPAAYIEASMLARELGELGAMWHGCYWSTHRVLDHNPIKKGQKQIPWNWFRPVPKSDEWKPRVDIFEDGSARVVFYTLSELGRESIYRQEDRYEPGSFVPRSTEGCVAKGQAGFVF